MAYSPGSGGFVRDDILTPPSSSVTSTVATPLPQPRQHPLKPGGSKESQLIRYLDQNILGVKRRWAKRKFKDEDAGDVKGYHSFKEASRDFDGLIDVVWVSGTPNIQIPYLLNLAGLIVDFLPDFPPSPGSTFQLLEKLDNAFSSLLRGKDLDTDEPLSGFGNGKKVNTTEKVRIKGIVERTRIAIVQMMSKEYNPGFADGDNMETDGDDDDDHNMDEDDDEEEEDEEDHTWDMDIGRVYERTIGELGEELGGPRIGIITDG
ncbi:hypothetical protein GQ43DRAFT_487164 [Delitschia confertaspora ATCC 74209]|uniref:Uncharacterized protein n=1 Tax=Delitschia confertaspora ATCC 74209 TaxID=1513339 RepID=A0A9P4MWN5_9PLEO|nr:hypothetical protein GQ43DRAFT_487164 [Delitschia confertaspora ATCC 74209]